MAETAAGIAAMFGGGGGGGIGAALPGFLQGIFGDSGAPGKAAGEAYQPWLNKGIAQQNPFYNAGTAAIPNFQNWLQGQKDPAAFINMLMQQYQQSPMAKYEQNQAVRLGQNAASAGGLSGSTPFAQQLQQNAQNISSTDIQSWLQNVLGINAQYGAGEGALMSGGQHSADVNSQLYGNAADYMGGAAYNQKAGENYDQSQLFGGIAKLFGG